MPSGIPLRRSVHLDFAVRLSLNMQAEPDSIEVAVIVCGASRSACAANYPPNLSFADTTKNKNH
jgi:hypothetical protein